MASQARPCRRCLRVERYQEGSPDLSSRRRERFPAGRWKAELRAREHRRIVLHSTHLLAESISLPECSTSSTRLQPRPRPDGGAKPPGSRGILEHSSQFSVLGLQCSNCKTHASTVSRNSGVLLFYRLYRPSHARSIVGNPETSQNIQQNDSPMAVQALFQIVHRFRRHPLG